MAKQIVIRSPLSMERKQPLLDNQDYSSRRSGSSRKVKLAEVAGGTAGKCAAVCCCCPFTLVNLVVLTVYKLPAGLCRKVLRRHITRRRKLMDKELLPPQDSSDVNARELQMQTISGVVNGMEMAKEQDVVELDKEMWDKFYSAGFWRSSSQRSEYNDKQM